jgi:heme/copper-type cytochrome/quinol oxidase subunit 2
VVGRDIDPGVTEIHRCLVGIEAEVMFDIVISIGMVKRLDRSVEISILCTFIKIILTTILITMVCRHRRKRHQYNDKAAQDSSHGFYPSSILLTVRTTSFV